MPWSRLDPYTTGATQASVTLDTVVAVTRTCVTGSVPDVMAIMLELGSHAFSGGGASSARLRDRRSRFPGDDTGDQ